MLFTDPKFHPGTLSGWGSVTNIGGKSSWARFFTISCDKRAANQIDWDWVTV